jgi:hypothetical protein
MLSNKTFFIEFYNQSDNSLLNKYKFTLNAVKVSELKSQIKDRLINKKDIEADSELIIKDIDDFELASDDEVNQVLNDGKIKLFKKNKSQPGSQIPVSQVVISQNVSNPLSLASIVSQTENVVKSTILDLTNFKIPQLPAKY